MFKRPFYTDWLSRWKDKELIKVLTGMRRAGKSTVLSLFQEQLVESGIKKDAIVAINFESYEEEYPVEARALYDYIVERLDPSEKNYVFLDEVQRVKDFQKCVDALFLREDVDLYITGSDAYFLSGELATLLTGRYVELQVFPLSFKEYVSALDFVRPSHGGLDFPLDFPFDLASPRPSREEVFERYLNYGGLPYTVRLPEGDIAEYLAGVFNTILMNDIMLRKPQINTRAFKATASFLADNVGNLSSTNRIAKGLSEQGDAVSRGSIDDYIEALMENYLLFKAERYDLKGREYLKVNAKYYVGDLGFRYWLLGKRIGDRGHRIENLVYLELLRRFPLVSIGKYDTKEIDFIASDTKGGRHYFQVALSVLDEDVLSRELAPLILVSDSYPKTLLSLDVIGLGDFEGIEHVNLVDWLLGDS